MKPPSQDRSANLATWIVRHQELYDAGTPEISDSDYDAMVAELRKIDPANPALQHLGAPTSGKRKVTHAWPMLSLAKCYEMGEVIDWCIDAGVDTFQISPKYDGVSLSLIYEQGRLAEAVTRGDGKVGNSVLTNVLEMPSIPKTLREQTSCVVRGEAIFSKASWARLKPVFEKRAEARAGEVSARNAAAGTLQAKNTLKRALTSLEFIAYDRLTAETPGYESLGDELRRLMMENFSTGLIWTAPVERARHYLGVATEHSLECEYDTDGVVIKTDSYAARKKLGATAHHPRWAIALKFQGNAGTTILRDVVWQVSRSSMITPVAIVYPITLSEASISRATLHNLGYFESLQLSAGAKVEMTRRGGVIPHVERRVSPVSDTLLKSPSECPCCKGPVKRKRDILYCVNFDECPDVQRQRLLFWASQTDMMGWGEEVISALYNDGDVLRRSELYKLPMKMMVSLFGKVAGPKLCAEAALKSKMSATTFLKALGIDGIGESQSAKIVDKFDQDIRKLLAWAQQPTRSDLSLPGIGAKLENNLRAGLQDLSQEIVALLNVVTITTPTRSAVAVGPFAGKKVVFTGKLSDMEREDARAAVREHGGETPTGVTKQTDILVIGDLAKEEQRTKRAKADDYIAKGYPIKLVTEADFLAMLVEAAKDSMPA